MAALVSMVVAPLGARTVHIISLDVLRKIFAGLFCFLGAKLLLDFWN